MDNRNDLLAHLKTLKNDDIYEALVDPDTARSLAPTEDHIWRLVDILYDCINAKSLLVSVILFS
jgi:hypothetical protein